MRTSSLSDIISKFKYLDQTLEINFVIDKTQHCQTQCDSGEDKKN